MRATMLCVLFINYVLSQCPPVNPRPDVDPWTMRLPSAGFGGITEQQINGFSDVYLTSPGGSIQVSARLDWGGTIVFFGQAGNYDSNTIDCHDTGRELQIALYDNNQLFQPCAQNNTCAESNAASCGQTNNWLGWDPVQGGDRCQHGSKIISYGQVGDALQVVVQPVQWNPDWLYSTCDQDCNGPVPVDVIYTFELRFVSENIVEVMTQIVSQETYDHAVSAQEFPCLYVTWGEFGLDLPVLLNSSGNQINFDPNIIDTVFFNTNAWATWQQPNTAAYGVGIASDQGSQQFVSVNGPASEYFHYVRPLKNFAITSGGTVRGISYLILGNFETVAELYDQVIATRPPFGWVDQPTSAAPIAYTPGQQILFEGWALSSWNIFITIEVDGNPVSYVNCNITRPDVCAIYPAYAGCMSNAVGFIAYLDTSALDASCSHLVSIYASDNIHGNDSLIGDRVITPQ